jgi:hypothetical protein
MREYIVDQPDTYRYIACPKAALHHLLTDSVQSVVKPSVGSDFTPVDWEFIDKTLEGTPFPSQPDIVIKLISYYLPCESQRDLFNEHDTSQCTDLQEAMNNGHTICCDHHFKMKRPVDWSKMSLTIAATFGHFRCLELAYANGAIIHQREISLVNDFRYRLPGNHEKCIEMYASMGYRVAYSDDGVGELHQRRYADYGGFPSILPGHIDPPRIHPRDPELPETHLLVTEAAKRGDFKYLKQAYINGATVYQEDIDQMCAVHRECSEDANCEHYKCMEMYRQFGYMVGWGWYVTPGLGLPSNPRYWDYGGLPLIVQSHNDKFETYPKLNDAYERRLYGGILTGDRVTEPGPDGMGALFDLESD